MLSWRMPSTMSVICKNKKDTKFKKKSRLENNIFLYHHAYFVITNNLYNYSKVPSVGLAKREDILESLKRPLVFDKRVK